MKPYYVFFVLIFLMLNEFSWSESIRYAKLMQSINPLSKILDLTGDDGKTTKDAISSKSLNYIEKFLEISNETDCKSVHKSCLNHSRESSIRTDTFICSCNSECPKYGDCCLDSKFENNNLDVKFQCIITNEEPFESYYMINRCPSYWDDNNTKLFCEIASTYNSNNVLTRVPVTSKNNLQTYRNIYCAICNNADDVVAWIPHHVCYDSLQNCVKKYTPPKNLKPKQCNSIVNSTCNTSEDRFLQLNCANFYAPVRYTNSQGNQIIYKNKFCALCSGVKSSDNLECSDGMVTTMTTLKSIIPEENISSIYLNFVFFNGDVILEIEKCPMNMQQPWKNCYTLYCQGLFQYENGKCLMKSNRELIIIKILMKSSLNSTCSKITITSDNYEAFENGFLLLKKYQKLLQTGDYQMISSINRSLLICDPLKGKIYQLSKEQYYLIIICFSISANCLIVKIILHLLGSQKSTLVTTAVFYLSVSLFLGQLLFLSSSGKIHDSLCTGIAIFKHYFFMVSICCTNPIGFGIWKTFLNFRSQLQEQGRKVISCAVYCWGVPTLIVIAAIITEWAFKSKFNPRYGSNLYNFCWISNRLGFLLFFAIPLLLVLLINIIFCVTIGISIIKISKSSKCAKNSNIRRNYLMFALFLTLTLIIVFTWIIGFAASYSESEILWPPFIVLNGVQGVYLLFSFTNFDSLKNCCKKIRRRKNRYNYNVRNAHTKSIKMEEM
ncbi:uncharacterized protein LOC111618353 [Centruroides sculpturatus]|uniref:uncharacterized protein LOC111618353 n=1 Tax=Centruroides sculpturatus TaxID=218467 RepID=UPI000C6D8E82|nr:uncharacterized protein LOC111618353 [Centruroides sculpturatus]